MWLEKLVASVICEFTVKVGYSLRPQLFLEPQCPGIRTGPRVLSLLRKGWSLFLRLCYCTGCQNSHQVGVFPGLVGVWLVGLTSLITDPVKLSLELCRPRPLLQALWRCALLADGSSLSCLSMYRDSEAHASIFFQATSDSVPTLT